MLLDPDLAAWEILKGFLLKAVSRRPPDGAERNILEKLTSNHMRRITPEEQKDAAQVIFEEVERKHLDLARIEYLLNTFNWNESGHDMVRCEWKHDEGRWGGGLASLYEAETDDGEKVLPIAVSDVLDDTIRRVGSKHTDDAMTMKGAFTTDNDIFSIMHDSHATKLRFTTLLDQMVENNPEGISETAKDKKGEFKFKWFRRNMATARESKTVKDAFKHMMVTDEELTE